MAEPVTTARALDPDAVARVLRRADAAPWLHGEVARRMAERLRLIRLQPEHVIDWWGRLGAGGDELAKAYPAARRTVVEPTPALVAASIAAAKKPWWSLRGPAVQVRSDAALAPLHGSAQLLWSNMVLHAELDPPALFERWRDLLRIDGVVMFSCLGPGTLRQLRALYAEMGWGRATPGFVDMHDLGDMLVHAGFADPVMDQETIELRWATPQALLAELRTLGANAAPDRFAGCRTSRWRQRLVDSLAATAGADGKIGLSFEVAYGHAFKGAPKLRAGEPVVIGLEDLRAMARTPRPD